MELTIEKAALFSTIGSFPEIRGKVQRGLSGTSLLDHLIGLVENAHRQAPENLVLNACYRALRREYPLHFATGGEPRALEEKPLRYKACNGF